MDPWDATPYVFDSLYQHPEPGSSTLQEQGLNEQFMADQYHAPNQLSPSQEAAFQGFQNASNPEDAQMRPPPKPRKRKAPTLRAKDWEPYKVRILELHDTPKMSLQKIKETIEEEFGFVAEIRQYRTRITNWGKDKNIKPAEMAAIVRKRQHRTLLESHKNEQSFTVRGREVETHKIDRWMTRNGISHIDLYVPNPKASTPSAVGCQTISERGSLGHSPAFSTMSLHFSSRGTTPIASHPVPPSPTLSVQEIFQSRGSSFTGQSPAPIYQALPIHFPASHPPVPDPFHDQSHAEFVLKRSRYKQAKEESLRADLSVAEVLFGTDHPRTHEVLENLADVLMTQGRYKSAEEIIRRLVESHQNATGNSSPSIREIFALHLLAQVLVHQGLYLQAQKLQQWVFESRKTVLGDEHPSTLFTMGELVRIYIYQLMWIEAEELGVQALEVSRRVLGEEHLVTLYIMGEMVVIHTWFRRLNEAEKLGLHCLEMYKRVLGEEDPSTIACMGDLTHVYRCQERWEDAEVLCIQVVDMRMRILGEGHPSTLASKENLARLYTEQQRYREAEEIGEHVLEMRKRILGGNHPETLQMAEHLLDTYKKQGKSEKAEDLGMYISEIKRN